MWLRQVWSAKTPSGGFQRNVTLLHPDRPVSPASVFCPWQTTAFRPIWQFAMDTLEKAQELLDQKKKGLKIDESRSSLSQFLREFLQFYQSEGGVSLRTWQDYRYHIEENIIPGLGGLTLKELKPRHVDVWMK